VENEESQKFGHDTKEVTIFESYSSLKEKVIFKSNIYRLIFVDRPVQRDRFGWNALRLHSFGRRRRQMRLWTHAQPSDDG